MVKITISEYRANNCRSIGQHLIQWTTKALTMTANTQVVYHYCQTIITWQIPFLMTNTLFEHDWEIVLETETNHVISTVLFSRIKCDTNSVQIFVPLQFKELECAHLQFCNSSLSTRKFFDRCEAYNNKIKHFFTLPEFARWFALLQNCTRHLCMDYIAPILMNIIPGWYQRCEVSSVRRYLKKRQFSSTSVQYPFSYIDVYIFHHISFSFEHFGKK